MVHTVLRHALRDALAERRELIQFFVQQPPLVEGQACVACRHDSPLRLFGKVISITGERFRVEVQTKEVIRYLEAQGESL